MQDCFEFLNVLLEFLEKEPTLGAVVAGAGAAAAGAADAAIEDAPIVAAPNAGVDTAAAYMYTHVCMHVCGMVFMSKLVVIAIVC